MWTSTDRLRWNRLPAWSTGGMKIVLLVVLMTSLAGCGLTAPRSSEGYANLDSLGMSDTDRVISLSFGPALLRLAARFVDDEPEVQDLLRSLDGVRVRVYEVNGDASRVAARMEGMSTRLQDDGWEPVMLVREEDEQAHMLMRIVDGEIRGMTVLVLDGNTEAVIVNLMGDIEPERFGKVMVALDVNAGNVDEVEVADGEPRSASVNPG